MFIFQGNHKVYVDYSGIPVSGSPFTVKVFDARLVRVDGVSPGLVNKPSSFSCKFTFVCNCKEYCFICGDESDRFLDKFIVGLYILIEKEKS